MYEWWKAMMEEDDVLGTIIEPLVGSMVDFGVTIELDLHVVDIVKAWREKIDVGE